MSWMLEDVELLRPAGLHPPSLVLSGQEVALWREDSCVVRSPSLQASQLPRWSIIPGSWQMLPLSHYHSFCSLTAKNKIQFQTPSGLEVLLLLVWQTDASFEFCFMENRHNCAINLSFSVFLVQFSSFFVIFSPLFAFPHTFGSSRSELFTNKNSCRKGSRLTAEAFDLHYTRWIQP